MKRSKFDLLPARLFSAVLFGCFLAGSWAVLDALIGEGPSYVGIGVAAAWSYFVGAMNN